MGPHLRAWRVSGLVLLLPRSYAVTRPPARPEEQEDSCRSQQSYGGLGIFTSPALPLLLEILCPSPGTPGHRPRLRSCPCSVVLSGHCLWAPSLAQMTVLSDLSHELFRPLC